MWLDRGSNLQHPEYQPDCASDWLSEPGLADCHMVYDRTRILSYKTLKFSFILYKKCPYFLGCLALMSTGGPGSPRDFGKMSTHICNLPCKQKNGCIIKVLKLFCLVDFSFLIYWMCPFPILGMSGHLTSLKLEMDSSSILSFLFFFKL